MLAAVVGKGIHTCGLALECRPPAGWVFEHAGIIECALSGVEVRIAPDTAQVCSAFAPGRARVGVDVGAVFWIPGDIEDALMG